MAEPVEKLTPSEHIAHVLEGRWAKSHEGHLQAFPETLVREALGIGLEQVGVLCCGDGTFQDMRFMACVECEPVYRLSTAAGGDRG